MTSANSTRSYLTEEAIAACRGNPGTPVRLGDGLVERGYVKKIQKQADSLGLGITVEYRRMETGRYPGGSYWSKGEVWATYPEPVIEITPPAAFEILATFSDDARSDLEQRAAEKAGVPVEALDDTEVVDALTGDEYRKAFKTYQEVKMIGRVGRLAGTVGVRRRPWKPDPTWRELVSRAKRDPDARNARDAAEAHAQELVDSSGGYPARRGDDRELDGLVDLYMAHFGNTVPDDPDKLEDWQSWFDGEQQKFYEGKGERRLTSSERLQRGLDRVRKID